jgi:hypothetical protein
MRDFSWINWRVFIYFMAIFSLSSLIFPERKPNFLHSNAEKNQFDKGNIVEIFSGNYFTCAKTLDNKTYCWGFSPLNSVLANPTPVPKLISKSLYSDIYLNNVEFSETNKNKELLEKSGVIFEHVYKSKDYECGITPEHSLFCWGHYLNNPDLANIDTPQPIFVYLNLPMNDLKFERLALGLNHICGVTIYADLYCWGDNTLGQLGVNGVKNSNEPLAVVLK